MTLLKTSDSLSSFSWPKPSLSQIALIAVILLGFALRVHDLEGQSMWSDEGLSLYRATLSVPEILANIITVDGVDTRDTNPPLYFLLLHLFRAATGETVFALRYFGVVTSTLSIPLIYILGSASLSRRVGLVAAVLMALSPFHVWQSQVLRNYGLLITLNLLSVYGLFRYVLAQPNNRKSRWLILWLAAGLIGIYTHFFAFFVFAFGLSALLITVVKEWGIGRLLKSTWFWVVLGIALVILLPATALAINRFAAGQQIDFEYVPLRKFLVETMSALSVGVNWSLNHPWWRVLPVVLIALLGLWFAWRRRPASTVLLLGYQIIPLALLYTLSYINPLYNGVRHLLIGLPPFVIFLASGIVGPGQPLFRSSTGKAWNRYWLPVGLFLALLIIVNQLSWLNNQFTSPRLVRDDVRGPAVYLSKHARAQDVVVLHDTLIRPTFDYYYDGVAPVVSVPQLDELDVKIAIQTLQEVTTNAERVWFLSEPTPRTGFDREALSTWVDDNWPRFLNIPYKAMWLRVRLEGYQPHNIMPSASDLLAENIAWEKTLLLHGYDVPDEVIAGEDWFLTFYISQPTQNPEQHTLSLRLVDEMGQVWAQMDETIEPEFPPMANVANTMMRYDHRVSVPPGIPSGRYALQSRLVRTADGTTIPMTNGEVEYHLADIMVHGSPCSTVVDNLPVDVNLKKNFGREIQLLGYNRPAAEIQPGFPVMVDLWWCAKRQPETDYRLRLQLINTAGQIVGESLSPLVREDYPTSQWQEDELLMGRSSLTVPANVEAGSYDLRLSLLQSGSDDVMRIGWPLGSRSLSLNPIMVTPLPLKTELPPISRSLLADFGQPPVIELHGYDLNTVEVTGDETLELRLVWRSIADNLHTSYKVFVHLLDESGEIVTQSDSVPANGFRPTTSWREGEVISDEYSLSAPIEIKSEEYALWIGLYDPETGLRLPIYVGGEEQSDGRLKLTTLTGKS